MKCYCFIHQGKNRSKHLTLPHARSRLTNAKVEIPNVGFIATALRTTNNLSTTPTSHPLREDIMTSKSKCVTLVRCAFVPEPPTRRILSRNHKSFGIIRHGHSVGRRRTILPIPDQHNFSTSALLRLADVNDSSSPRLQDRESDEVDVCIVGGGD